MRRLFLDIETCPCIGSFWRPGYKINLSYENVEVEARIITVAWKWQGDKKVHSLTWDRHTKKNGPFSPFAQSDKSIIETIVPIMNQADEIVAHYGDGFDLPWIRTRALFHGILTGVWKTVDTKAWACKHFILPSNKLDAIAKYLGIGKKIRTEYDLWRDITFCDDTQALAKMVRYNKHDVELLEKVYDKLTLYSPPVTHVGVLGGLEKWTCPGCGNTKVYHKHHSASATGIVKHEMYCGRCPRYYMINHAAYKKWLKANAHKR